MSFICCTRQHQTARANLFSKVTDLICRLPSTTFFHSTIGCKPRRPDAVSGTVIDHMFLLLTFQGSNGFTRISKKMETNIILHLLLWSIQFRRVKLFSSSVIACRRIIQLVNNIFVTIMWSLVKDFSPFSLSIFCKSNLFTIKF